jgi:hypothetical protein
MDMGWQLSDRERMNLLAASFTPYVPTADVDGCSTAQVGKCKIDLSITTKGSTQKRKQCLILIDGKQLAVA